MSDRIFNFSAGPSALPTEVLEKVQAELLNFKGTGMSVMEMSHRSAEYLEVIDKARDGVRKHLNVPDNYEILFLQGGASLQFSMIPMNLILEGKPVDMIHTGIWTKKAIKEIKKCGEVNIAASTEEENFSRLPLVSELKFSDSASYVHLCSNNTIAGTQWKTFPATGDTPLVADMSSDIFSRPVDVSKFGLIFAGAQKNIGPAGVTLVIIRKDLAELASETLPTLLQYRTHIAAESMANTPPTFGIYIISLVMDWIESQGGVAGLEKHNQAKAKILYDAIESDDFYYCPVKAEDRSLMNVVFRIKDNNEALEAAFVKEAKAAGLSGLKGHRLVGGLRASIYNAQSIAAVEALAAFMKEFSKKNA